MKFNLLKAFQILFVTMFFLTGSKVFAQQKVWTGTSKRFGIDTASNSGSVITWSVGKYTGSTTPPPTDSIINARAIYSRFSWVNPTSAMIVDTVKVYETKNGCVGATTTKLIEVYPLPTLTMGTNQSLCSGVSPSNFNLTISNYAAVSGIGTFTLSYELRAGSATGTALGGASSGSITGINSSTISVSTTAWPSMTAGTTYYFVITNFGSEIAATAPNPAPGNLSTADIAVLPRTYTITVNPAIVAPAIQAY